MKSIAKISILIVIIGGLFITPKAVNANQAACNPIDPKPQALGEMIITPDIIAVGDQAIARFKNDGASRINFDIPKNYFEVVDYSPKTIEGGTAKAGYWEGTLPTGNYDVTLKAKHYTAGKWARIDTQAAVWGGTSYGYQYFFIYYDTAQIELALSERNEVPQTTMDVVRKVTINTVPDIRLTLLTNKGSLGKDIATSSGQTINTKADSNGKAEVYLFAKEKDKVVLTATSDDTCQDTPTEKKFTVARSDVGRNIKDDNGWIFVLLVIVSVLLTGALAWYFVIRKKSKADSQNQENLQNNKTDVTESINYHDKPLVENPKINVNETPLITKDDIDNFDN